MIIRYALFEGEIQPGREAEFRAFVEDRLVPLWIRFPGAQEVRVQFGLERDDGAPHYAMVLAIRYRDMAAVERALSSDVRFQSRAVTQDLLKMFSGRVHHHVFETHEFVGRCKNE